MVAPITISRLQAYEGPNTVQPTPGVVLRLACDRDRGARIRAAIKDSAQAIGLVIGQLAIDSKRGNLGIDISVRFSCELPQLGAAVCAYVVAGITAEAVGDHTWDHEAPLIALRERRQREAVPLTAVQLIAEARRRGLPSFVTATRQLQIGYGVHGWSCDLATLPNKAPTLPWAELGVIPISIVTGASSRDRVVEQVATELRAGGQRVTALKAASFHATRALLADPHTEALVLGLTSEAIIRYGLPVEQCDRAIITDCSGPRPTEAEDDEEWVRALGLPMLIAAEAVRINLSDPGLTQLVPYAPNGVIMFQVGEG